MVLLGRVLNCAAVDGLLRAGGCWRQAGRSFPRQSFRKSSYACEAAAAIERGLGGGGSVSTALDVQV